MTHDDTMVRNYIGRAAFERDAEQLAAEGWRIAKTYERRRRPGKMRLTIMRWTAWLFPPEPEIIVTYRRGSDG